MLEVEEVKEVRKKLIDLGEKQNYLARKLKISPQRLSNILNRKIDSVGTENKIRQWFEKTI